MPESFQKEKPPARINLFLEVQKGNAKEKLELPQRMLMMGDYTGKKDDTAVGEREIININQDNFESVMKSMDVSADIVVKNKLSGGDDDDLPVNLKFENLDDFKPDEVAKQIPELNRLLAMRNLLQDLRNRVVSTREFRKELERIVKDKDSLAKLNAELAQFIAEAGSDASDKDQPAA